MINAIAKLYLYFRLVGIFSIVLWVVALFLLARFAFDKRRTAGYWVALILATFGLYVAKVNSAAVSMIGVDQKKSLAATRELAKKAEEKRLADEAAKKAEEEARERAEKEAREARGEIGRRGMLTAVTTDDDYKREEEERKRKEREEIERKRKEALARQQAATNAAATNAAAMVAEGGTNEAAAADWRTAHGGMAERDPTKKIEDKVLEGAAEDKSSGDMARSRTLPEKDVHRANHIDKLNMFFARLAIWLAGFLVATDYMLRFNTTFKAYMPLGVSCGGVDAVFPKRLKVWIAGTPEGRLRDFLERVVRKGESFVYFGTHDLWGGGERVEIGGTGSEVRGGESGLGVPVPGRVLLRSHACETEEAARQADHVPVLLRLPLLRSLVLRSRKRILCTAEKPLYGSTFAYESTWFGRYCFVVEGEDLAEQWLKELIQFLELRYKALATVWRTVNIVIGEGIRVHPEAMRRLLFLCDQARFKLILISSDPIYDSEIRAAFDEFHEEIPAPEHAMAERVVEKVAAIPVGQTTLGAVVAMGARKAHEHLQPLAESFVRKVRGGGSDEDAG